MTETDMYAMDDDGIRTRSRDREDWGATSMFHLGLIDIILAEREREIENAMRRRRLLRPEDGATEPAATARSTSANRGLTARTRPTGG